MIELQEHTIDESIIDRKGYCLDLGCVNFKFSEGLRQYCDNVISLDPNPNIIDPKIDGIIYEQKAIHIEEGTSKYNFFNDKQGNSLLTSNHDWCVFENSVDIKTTTIDAIMKKYNIKQFELIKIDIEGFEYKLLENLDFRVAKQFSIEFHDFRGMNPFYPNNQRYYDEVFLPKITQYCDAIKHICTHHPGFPQGKGYNYWDSLFKLKQEYYI